MKPKPQVPDSLPIRQALASCEPLTLLRLRLRESAARFEAIKSGIPSGLIAQMQPGPLDDESWTLLVQSQAAAAKLRHLQPRMEAALGSEGLPARQLRIKVKPQK